MRMGGQSQNDGERENGACQRSDWSHVAPTPHNFLNKSTAFLKTFLTEMYATVL